MSRALISARYFRLVARTTAALASFARTTARRCAVVVLAALAFMTVGVMAADDIPTPEEYVNHVGGDARIVPPNQLKLDGNTMDCGHRPTVLDSQLDDYGAAYGNAKRGFVILNPKLLARTSTVVKMWIFAHECGHQFRGPDEETADCFAVQRGKRRGWRTEEGVEEICRFISPAKGDSMHFAGSNRCAYMRKCFADPTIH
ncbi:MAG: hypothetical protein SH859_14160 [Hyphomicrobium aestuarii]|nr:hypothetical protein [Hyphomicrobium aestuarii]